MEYGTKIQKDGTFPIFVSLFESLENISGIIRVDTHRCTTTLGKWYITATKETLETTITEIDNKLTEIPNFVPSEIINNTIYKDFTSPERLSATRKPRHQTSNNTSISTTKSMYST